MPNDAIVIVDSSEDENEPPEKKYKEDTIKTTPFLISNITSLSSAASSQCSDVVIIDDDDDVMDTKLKRKENNGIMIEKKTETLNIDTAINKAKTKTIHDVDEVDLVEEIENNTGETVEELMEDLKNTVDESSNAIKRRESTSQKISVEFSKFLDICESCNCDKRYAEVMKKRMSKIKERYFAAVPEFTMSRHFLALLQKSIERIEKKANDAVVCFNDVYQELGARKDKGVVLEDKHVLHLKKLNSFLRKIGRKITELENQPVDWDEDANSSYIKLDRFRKRFCDVHKKICSYTKENINAGRMIYNLLNFDASKHIVLNRAIDRLYNRTKAFPTYYEVDKCIRQCVLEKNVNLTGERLDAEIKHIFTALGQLLQRRRKTELQVVLTDFLESSSDPAKESPELNSILEKQFKAGEEKMNAVLQKFTDRQLNGEEPELSSESNNSHEESDTEENNVVHI